MNVLLLEDRGSAGFYVEEWLKAHGHNVLSAFNPNDAQSHWQDRETTPVHCIILDLYVPTEGLSEAQIAESEDGLLSGWVWFRDSVLRDEPKMKQRTIIYSDYVPTLRNSSHVDPSEYRGISIIPKRRRSSSARDVISRIQEVARASS